MNRTEIPGLATIAGPQLFPAEHLRNLHKITMRRTKGQTNGDSNMLIRTGKGMLACVQQEQ